MSDKSQLEKDIERRELVKIPFSVLVLIALLSVALGSFGVYTYKVRHDIETIKEETTAFKRNCDREKSELQAVIKRLETWREFPGPSTGSVSGDPPDMPPASQHKKGREDSAE